MSISPTALSRFDLDVSPAALGAGGPTGAAMHLHGDASLAAEDIRHFLGVVIRTRECLAVELADLRPVQPSRDLRRLADALDAGRVPIAYLPRLDPIVATDAVTRRSLFIDWLGRQPNQALPVVVDAEQGKGPIVEAARPFAVDVADVARFVVIDHHLEALPLVVGAQEQTAVDAPIGFQVD